MFETRDKQPADFLSVPPPAILPGNSFPWSILLYVSDSEMFLV